MLQQLTIRDFAIIDRLTVDWAPGFNVITGETGAGKSIIIDAVGALLGDRVGTEVVRTGAERAVVEGVFHLGEAPSPDLAVLLDEFGLEPEDGALIVSREVAVAGGRGGARINGRAVPLSVLQQLGEQLVDVHGQSQHMALLRVREHLEYLDRYAGVHAERARVAGLVRELRATREEAQALRAAERQAAREQEMLRHEIAEIERASVREGEEEDLQALRSRLRNVERLRQAALIADAALNGAEADGLDRPGAVERVGEALAACQDGARFDAALGAHVEGLTGALGLVEDAARGLRDYLDSVEADPAVLEQTEERLFALADLKRKYGETIGDVFRYLDGARRRLDAFEHRDERLAELSAAEERLLKDLAAAAGDLSAQRRKAGEELARAVERELDDLHMQGTRFVVALSRVVEPDGVPWEDGRHVAFDLTGVDHVEFLISPNAGEEPRPMARIASGGELARIALALKTILSRADTRGTLIFDEVDEGVGGRTAPVVGEKLWGLASTGHQVLCVTHMPQVAAYADQHWIVAKSAADGRSHSRIQPLAGVERVDELAAMLAGSATDVARESARELKERADRFKVAVRSGVDGRSDPATAPPMESPNGRASSRSAGARRGAR